MIAGMILGALIFVVGVATGYLMKPKFVTTVSVDEPKQPRTMFASKKKVKPKVHDDDYMAKLEKKQLTGLQD